MNEKVVKIEEIISALTNKEGNVYFFALDTKNAPNGEVKYIYDIALALNELGYKVTLLHQEEEYVGPLEWLGEKYSKLEVKNIKTENVVITPCDTVFVPEVFTNVMSQIKSLPCKKVMIYYNPSYLIDYIPTGMTMADMNVYDAITTNDNLKEKLNSYFPNMNVRVVRPSISHIFDTDDEPKKLIVNLLTPSSSETNDIIKPFFWKYPAYKWISFREMKGITQETLAEVMREAAITVWVDDNTNNGITALEALKSGSILIAKTPQTPPEWMLDGGEYRFGIIWVDTYDMLHDVLASVIRGWTRDDIVEGYMKMSNEVKFAFTESSQKKDVENFIVNGIFDDTIKTYKHLLAGEKNKK